MSLNSKPQPLKFHRPRSAEEKILADRLTALVKRVLASPYLFNILDKNNIQYMYYCSLDGGMLRETKHLELPRDWMKEVRRNEEVRVIFERQLYYHLFFHIKEWLPYIVNANNESLTPKAIIQEHPRTLSTARYNKIKPFMREHIDDPELWELFVEFKIASRVALKVDDTASLYHSKIGGSSIDWLVTLRAMRGQTQPKSPLATVVALTIASYTHMYTKSLIQSLDFPSDATIDRYSLTNRNHTIKRH